MKNRRITLNLLALALLLVMRVYSQDVKPLAPVIDYTFDFKDYTAGKNRKMKDLTDSELKGWEFNEECYALGGGFMQVGSGVGIGKVKTPEVGQEGNVVLLIKTKGVKEYSGTYTVNLEGNGEVESKSYTVGENASVDHPSAILIKGCSPKTKIIIEGESGKFIILSIRAYAIGSGIFFESFSFLEGQINEEFSFSGNSNDVHVTPEECDNKNCSLSDDVQEVYQSVYLTGNEYQLPALTDVIEGQRYILSFLIASKTPTEQITVKVTGDRGQLSPFNSNDLLDLEDNREMKFMSSTIKKWIPYYLVISGMTTETRIAIQGNNVFLDDVKLSAVPTVTLSQDAANDTVISENVGLRNVQLERTLAAGCWVPLCLPFDVDYTSMAAATGGQEPRLAVFSSADNGIFHFSDVEKGSTIVAGTPFLTKLSKKVEIPEFHEVLLTNAASATVIHDGYKVVGIYNPITMLTNGTQLFLGTDGYLYIPNEGGNLLGGLRAYFEVPSDNSRVQLSTPDEEANGIKEVSSGEASSVMVDLLGRKAVGNGSLRLRIDPLTGRKTLIR